LKTTQHLNIEIDKNTNTKTNLVKYQQYVLAQTLFMTIFINQKTKTKSPRNNK